MMMRVKNHQTPPTMRPERDLRRGDHAFSISCELFLIRCEVRVRGQGSGLGSGSGSGVRVRVRVRAGLPGGDVTALLHEGAQ
ncbi:hypothetical protein EYF80_059357 [Liparis tanakae]|uniref:Uncharacterized protein n=1 Tax=Liparis tanakae TaxID=230148 RepID=A0A4Z2EPL5_9TELE|nr:hypothetical protein EYF80_059357 [Liparis tanakae]